MKLKLQEQLKDALRNKDKIRLETIRSIISEIQYAEMQAAKDSIPDEEAVAIVQREIKKRREEIQFADQANRPEAKEKSLTEIAILESFLPAQLNEAEIEKTLQEFQSQTPGANLGTAMAFLKKTFAGQYDGKTASLVAKRIFG